MNTARFYNREGSTMTSAPNNILDHLDNNLNTMKTKSEAKRAASRQMVTNNIESMDSTGTHNILQGLIDDLDVELKAHNSEYDIRRQTANQNLGKLERQKARFVRNLPNISMLLKETMMWSIQVHCENLRTI